MRSASPDELEIAREVVERRAASRAAQRTATDRDGVLTPGTLGDAVAGLRHGHLGSPDRWLAKDAAFHDALCRMGGRGSVLGAYIGSVILARLRPMRSAAAHRLVVDGRLLQLHFDLAAAVSGGKATLASGIAARIMRREAAALREGLDERR